MLKLFLFVFKLHLKSTFLTNRRKRTFNIDITICFISYAIAYSIRMLRLYRAFLDRLRNLNEIFLPIHYRTFFDNLCLIMI